VTVSGVWCSKSECRIFQCLLKTEFSAMHNKFNAAMGANLVERFFSVSAPVPDELSTSELQRISSTQCHHAIRT